MFKGVQPYDPVNKTLVIPKIYDHPGDKDSYSASFDWEKAIAAGMAEVGADFSGKVDFIKTQMIWPITHGDLSAGRMKSVPGLNMRLRFKYQP